MLRTKKQLRRAAARKGAHAECRKVKSCSSEAAPINRLSPSNIRYVALFGLIERALQRFEMLPANSTEASLLLNSATSAAKMYRLFAIKWVGSQPRFS